MMHALKKCACHSRWLFATICLAPLAHAAAEPAKPFTIALFGDSITRGVIADHVLGETLSQDTQDNLAKFQLIAPLFSYVPEGFGVLNYNLMAAFDFVQRDHLAAVQGNQPYAVVSRLKAATGRGTDVLNVAHLGGTYREGDTQLSLYKSELAKRNLSSADLAIVDFGRVDYSLFPSVEQFQKQVDRFFAGLFAISPNVRVLITLIPNEVQVLDRPDRVALEIPGKAPITCKTMLGDTITLGRSGINVGQDNSKLLPEAISRYNGYNYVLLQTASRLRQVGGVADTTETLADRANPEDWDKVFAYDCTHMNLAGQKEIADHIYPVAAKLLAEPAMTPDLSKLPTKNTPNLSTKGLAIWQEYLNTVPAAAQLQDGCKPELLMPEDGAAYKGAVFLMHSFTSCPREMRGLADKLRTKGYAVVLPLLPGHGLKPRASDIFGKLEDDLSQLPLPRLTDPHNYRTEYNQIAATMTELADEFAGTHAVVGYSLGATVAAAMTQLFPSRWDRQLLVDPFYELNDGFQRAAFGAILVAGEQDEKWWTAFAPLLAKRTSWGLGCEWGRQDAGYCQFTYGQALAASEFGRETWQLLQPTTIKTQVVGRAEGSLANPAPVFAAVGQMRNEKIGLLPYESELRLDAHPDVRVCQAGSSGDGWWQEAHWVDAFARFVQDGQGLPATAERVNGDPRCVDAN